MRRTAASFTVHELDGAVYERLAEKARAEGMSKNQLVKDILTRATGLRGEGGLSDDYREFCGVWTVAERSEFESRQAENEAIDAEDWRP
jgi:Acetate kinase